MKPTEIGSRAIASGSIWTWRWSQGEPVEELVMVDHRKDAHARPDFRPDALADRHSPETFTAIGVVGFDDGPIGLSEGSIMGGHLSHRAILDAVDEDQSDRLRRGLEAGRVGNESRRGPFQDRRQPQDRHERGHQPSHAFRPNLLRHAIPSRKLSASTRPSLGRRPPRRGSRLDGKGNGITPERVGQGPRLLDGVIRLHDRKEETTRGGDNEDEAR
jgi:hypothetical protein